MEGISIKSNSRIDAIKEMIGNDKNKLKSAINAISDLEEEVDIKSRSYKSLYQQSQGLQRNCRVLSDFCKKSRIEISQLQSQNNSLNKQINLLTNQREKYIQTSAENSKLLSQKSSLNESLKQQINQYEILKQRFETQSERLANIQRTSSERHTQTLSAHGASLARIDELTIMLNSISIENDSLSKKINEINNQKQGILSNKNELENQIKTLSNKNITLSEKVTKLENILNRAKLDRDNYKSDYQRVKKDRDKIQQDYNTQTNAYQKTQEIVQSLEYEVKAIQSSRDDFIFSEQYKVVEKKFNETILLKNKEIEENQKKIQSLTSNLDEKIEELNQIQKLLQTRSVEIVNLRNNIEIYTSKIKEMEQLCSKINVDNLNELEITLTKTKNSLNSAEEKVYKLEDSNEKLKEDNTHLRDELKILSNELKNQNHEISDLNDQNNVLKQSIAQLREQFNEKTIDPIKESEYQKKLKEADDRFLSLQNDYGNIKTSEKELKEYVDQFLLKKEEYIVETRSQISSRIDNLISENNNLKESLQDQQKLNEKLTNSFKTVELEQKQLQDHQHQLRITVGKLISAEIASEATFTCMVCLNLFVSPVTSIPCGHNFCEECVKDKKECPTCVSQNPVASFPKLQYFYNELLDQLKGKFVFRKQALEDLKSTVNVTNPNSKI